MKKVLSVILVMCLLFSLTAVSVFADDTTHEKLFLEKFLEQYKNTYGYNEYMCRDYYKEVYYHYNEDENLEWVLVWCAYIDSPSFNYAVFGDRVYLGGYSYPLATGYGLFDVEQDKFFDVCDIEDISAYSGFEEILYERIAVYPVGDANMDRDLDILDATFIQRALVQLSNFDIQDDFTASGYHSLRGDLSYLSDFNRDGERTILDATAIQMKLAKAENTATTE
ncbi:MAG: hypothetical protein IJO20_00925 [Ruminococcus sp.]|nr:hypothetical protein [Ruminococcus sp.]